MLCYNCDEEIREGEEYYSDITGECYCESCYDDIFTHCYDCDCEIRRDYAYCDDDCNYYCDDCWEDGHADDAINGYHTFSDSGDDWEILLGKDEVDSDNLMKTGFELEVVGNDRLNEVARYLRENFDIIQDIERDGSVDGGFEIITKPFTKKALEEYVGKQIKEMTEYLQSNGFVSHNTSCCGLHVHTTRSAYGKDDKEREKNISRLILFTEFYKKELKTFSRRKSYSYCHFTSEYNEGSNIDEIYFKSSKVLKDLNDNYSRYQVVNTQNSNTIELRVFRGTLKYETLMATLDFVFELTSQIINRKNSKISWDTIVNNSKSEYLKEYCETRNIFNSQKLTDEAQNIEKILKVKRDKITSANKEYNNVLMETLTKIKELQKKLDIDITSIKDNRSLISAITYLNKELSNMFYNNATNLKNEDYTISDSSIIRYQLNSLGSEYDTLNNNLVYISTYNLPDDIVNELRALQTYVNESSRKLNEISYNANNNNTDRNQDEI